MLIQTVFRAASLFFLYKFFDKALAGKVKFQPVVIRKVFLQRLLEDSRFLSLFFSSVYDNRVLAKDKIGLVAHIQNEDTRGPMIKHRLETTEGEIVFNNERNYSCYEIKKEELRDLLERGGSEAEYFFLRPVTYALDADYVSYNIIAADRFKIEFSEKHGDYAYTARLNPSPPAVSSYEAL